MTSPAFAYYKTANDLIEGMRDYDKVEMGSKDVSWYAIGFYRGYVMGVYDSNDLAVCSPNGMKAEQVFAVVGKYLKDHPEQWSDPADRVVLRALKLAFPCKK